MNPMKRWLYRYTLYIRNRSIIKYFNEKAGNKVRQESVIGFCLVAEWIRSVFCINMNAIRTIKVAHSSFLFSLTMASFPREDFKFLVRWRNLYHLTSFLSSCWDCQCSLLPFRSTRGSSSKENHHYFNWDTTLLFVFFFFIMKSILIT